jgi:cold shock CspA family protein
LKETSTPGDEEDVKYSPPGLNKGEWHFVEDLKDYLCSPVGETFMAGKELYLLRNQSRGHGVGFLVNSGRYYPDFILWLHTPEEKHIVFIDPKGLQFAGNLMENDKVQFARKIKDYGQALSEEDGPQDVHLHAFVVSRTSFQTLQARSELQSKEDFREHHILFPEGRDPASSYVNTMLSDIAYQEEQLVGKSQ